jgi:hypothetical protein
LVASGLERVRWKEKPWDGRELWTDEAGTHPTCKSFIAAELKAALVNRDAWLDGKEGPDWPRNGALGKGMPRLEAKRAEKEAIYAPLLAVARKQFRMGKRHTRLPPQFIATVWTSYGEVSSELIQLQEDMVAAYKRKLVRDMGDRGVRDDGETLAALTATKRTEMRTTLMINIAKRVASIMEDAGHGSSLTKKRAEAWQGERSGVGAGEEKRRPTRPPLRRGGKHREMIEMSGSEEMRVSREGTAMVQSRSDVVGSRGGGSPRSQADTTLHADDEAITDTHETTAGAGGGRGRHREGMVTPLGAAATKTSERGREWAEQVRGERSTIETEVHRLPFVVR